MCSPGARPSSLPTVCSDPSMTYTLLSLPVSVQEVVATRRCPAYSSRENWFRRVPGTSPEAAGSIETPSTRTWWIEVHVCGREDSARMPTSSHFANVRYRAAGDMYRVDVYPVTTLRTPCASSRRLAARMFVKELASSDSGS